MDDIGSFNELIFAAQLAKFRLHILTEDDRGFWKCAWRKENRVFKIVERRLPFNALLDAFLAARDMSAAPEKIEDLFG